MPKYDPSSTTVIEYCRVYNNADLSLSNNTDTLLTFNSERQDPYTLHSTSSNTGRITFPTAGFRTVGAHVTFAANATGRRQVYIRLNGTTIIGLQHSSPPGDGTSECGMSVVTGYYFAANDYVEVMAYQNSGGNLDVKALASTNYGGEFWSCGIR